MPASTRPMLIAGERRKAALVDVADEIPEGVALAYGLFEGARPGFTSLGGSLVLERPLRLRGLLPVPVLFGGQPRKGFREITVNDPRFSRLWGRFSVDVRVAIERDEKLFGARVFDRPGAAYRVFIVEDGDRYAIRGMCVFTLRGDTGHVLEVLHDRTVEGMRAALHVLGHALATMRDAGAVRARAVSLPHGGSSPMYALHAFRPAKADRRELQVRALDPAVADVVTEPELWYASYLDLDEV